MAEEEILRKLRMELSKEIVCEPQVVYIMSRIRKILELENSKNRYKILNFYCNWTLHSVINDTRAVQSILNDFITNVEARASFLYYKNFIEDFSSFLYSHGLPSEILKPANTDKFLSLLSDVLSDTPLEFKTPSNSVKLILKSVDIENMVKGLRYEIRYN